LTASPTSPTAVTDAICACAVSCHADE
jgi:hypothetical protein